MVVPTETEQMDIQIKFVEMTCRDDLTIILINQWVASSRQFLLLLFQRAVSMCCLWCAHDGIYPIVLFDWID